MDAPVETEPLALARAIQYNGPMEISDSKKDATGLSSESPIAPVIARIIDRLAPEEVWLFGSRAEGRERPDSDYDLLAVLPDDAPESALDLVAAWELVSGLGIPTDLVPCTRSDFEAEKNEVGTLARAAYHNGKLLCERRS